MAKRLLKFIEEYAERLEGVKPVETSDQYAQGLHDGARINQEGVAKTLRFAVEQEKKYLEKGNDINMPVLSMEEIIEKINKIEKDLGLDGRDAWAELKEWVSNQSLSSKALSVESGNENTEGKRKCYAVVLLHKQIEVEFWLREDGEDNSREVIEQAVSAEYGELNFENDIPDEVEVLEYDYLDNRNEETK